MREIKFKGLIEYPDGKRCWYIYGIGSKPHLIGYAKWIVEDLQFTGLMDKQGKEIYEGDIVKGDFWIGKDTGVIKFGHYTGQTINDDLYYGTGFYISYENDREQFGLDKDETLEVIGNVTENLKLLEGGE